MCLFLNGVMLRFYYLLDVFGYPIGRTYIMQRAIPIETVVGFIEYRDTIHLDKIESNGNDWVFIGEFNGSHVTKSTDGRKWIPFRFTFMSVQNIFSYDIECEPVELFSCGKDDGDVSCFQMIENSEFLKQLPIRDDISKEKLCHFCLRTYDLVFNLIATNYKLE